MHQSALEGKREAKGERKMEEGVRIARWTERRKFEGKSGEGKGTGVRKTWQRKGGEEAAAGEASMMGKEKEEREEGKWVNEDGSGTMRGAIGGKREWEGRGAKEAGSSEKMAGSKVEREFR